MAYPSVPTGTHKIYIYNNATATDLTATGPITLDDIDGMGFPNPLILSSTSIYTASAGELEIAYYQAGADITIDSPDIRGRIVLVPKIQKLWIVATPVCAGSTSDYTFEVHSIPELDQIIKSNKNFGDVFPIPNTGRGRSDDGG
jgi:hypothetical protein